MRRALPAAAMLVCLVHFASFDVGEPPLATDVRYYVYFAWRITEGAIPHRDFFDNKTQLASFAGAGFYALGEALGVDPLTAIRAGTLALTALGGLLAFAVGRRLGGGRGSCGLLALLAYCAFGLLGLMASIGNGPKLLMAIGASAAALLVQRRCWFWAGVAGALAFLDWQVGGLVWLAALVPACLLGRPRRRAALAVAAGGAAGLAPFAGYYAAHGALGATVDQVIGASLFRAGVVQATPLAERLEKLRRMAQLGCPEQQWLFYASALGLVVVGAWLWRWRGRDGFALLLPLAIYHVGLVAFSLVDFQYYGDFYALLHSAAFLLGALWIALSSGLDGWLVRRGGSGAARAVATGAACLLALGLARPGPLRPDIAIERTRAVGGDVTLADQRQVASALSERIGERTLVFLEHGELLFLMRRANGLPVIYWNRPTWSYFRRSEQESYLETGVRLVRSVDPDVVLYPPTRRRRLLGPDPVRVDFSPYLAGYRVERFASDGGRYAVELGFRESGP